MKRIKFLVLISIFISAILLFCGCAGYALNTPVNFSLDENNTLTWDEVTDARRYEVEITPYVEGGETKTVEAIDPALSLSFLAEGDYDIRVRAVGGKNFKDFSAWSSVINFQKDYENGCLYKLINNGTEYEISKVGSAKGTFEIKSLYRNKAVTSIADNAFKNSRTVENITIGENIEYIGANAFYNCRNLQSINIPTTVSTIGAQAFQNCGQLKEITLPDSVKAINEYTFAFCKSLTSFTFGKSVETIGEYAFSGCSSMEEFIIPDSVKTIGKGAFSGATAMKKLTIGKNVTELGEESFFRCTSLSEVKFATEGKLQTIGSYSFGECTALAAIELPNGLRQIGSRAFSASSALETVTIPETVKQVGASAFFGTKLYVDQQDKDFICAGTWLVACTGEKKNVLTEITLESFKDENGEMLNVIGIADKVFAQAPLLEKIKLPQTVKYIGAYAFQSCRSLTKLETFDGLKEIGEGAFNNCIWLNNLILGEGLERIGAYAFYGCKKVANTTAEGTSIIPSSVNSIGTYAFKDTTIWNNPDETTGIVYAGNWAVGFNELKKSSVELREGTVGIADYAFYRCEKLFTLSGADSDTMKYIGRSAFYECANLGTVSLPRSLTKIDEYTFYKCSSLYSIDIPSFVTSIGRSAFYKCESLSSVNLSKSRRLTEVGAYAFYGCLNMKELDFAETVDSIGEYAFANCSSLTSVTIPEKVTKIEKSTFYHCASLETVVFNDALEEIGVSAFNGCTSLTNIVLPDSVRLIDANAFYKCTSVTNLVLGAGVTEIGNYAFFGLENVEELELPASLETIGKYAFKGLNKVESIVLSWTVKEVGMHAFYGCYNATVYTDVETLPGEWHNRWNSSYRPVVWGCDFSQEPYWICVEITETTFSNLEREGTVIAAPERDGYVFLGWATSADGEVVYTADDVRNAPIGTTVYAVWDVASPEQPAPDDMPEA